MTTLSTHATDRGTFVVPVSFTDEAGNTVVPKSITWSLRNEHGQIVNEREDEEIGDDDLDATIEIVLQGDDLDRTAGRWRHLTTEAIYDSDAGSDLPSRDTCHFYIAIAP